MDPQNNYVVVENQKSPIFNSIKKSNLIKTVSVIGIFVSVLATILVSQNIYNPLTLFTKAVAGNATVEILPGSSVLPPEKAYTLWVTTDQKASFIRVIVNFDRNKLNVTQEPELVLTGFNKIIWTSMAEANQTGSLTFVAGLDPSQSNNAPMGAMRFASINFNAKQPLLNSNSTITIYSQDSQVVNIDTSLMAIAAKSTNVSIISGNSTTLPSPTARATSSPLATATSNPTASPTTSPNPTEYPAWDVDQNGHTNIVDIGLVIDNYDRQDFSNPRVDVNKNGVADIIDIGIIIDHYE